MDNDYDITEIRKTCKRCKGKLEIFPDPDDSKYYWCCNNPRTMFTDEQFSGIWSNLSGDEVVILSKD